MIGMNFLSQDIHAPAIGHMQAALSQPPGKP
jgi:hypothetical protein